MPLSYCSVLARISSYGCQSTKKTPKSETRYTMTWFARKYSSTVTRAPYRRIGRGWLFFSLRDDRFSTTTQREISIDKVRMVTFLVRTKYTPRNGSRTRFVLCRVVICGPDGEPLLGNCIPRQVIRGTHVQKRNRNWVNVLAVYCEPEAVCFHFSAEFQVLYRSTAIVD